MTSRKAAAYALDLCARIAAETDVPGTITRLFLSPATARVHALLTAEMQALGMTVHTDAIGNLRGLYPAASPAPDTPTLLLGSHIDTVPDAGPYDGVLGVALPLAALRLLHSQGTRLPYNIELIAFSEEEGIRFQLPFLGSRALIGTLAPGDLARTDTDGITLAQAIRNFGLDPAPLAAPLLTPNTFAFLELHIEQGPLLDTLNLPLAIVDTVAGQSRYQFTFTGQANHAGTTPMPLRRDGLAAAAQFVTAVERFARANDPLVATVGILEVAPNVANVVPGLVTLGLDLRHPDDQARLAAVEHLILEADSIVAARSLSVASRKRSEQASVYMDLGMRKLLLQVMPSPTHTMPSGAGHDAMILASHIPTAMLFLRSPGGISHHPAESVLPQDVHAALELLLHLLPTLPSPP